MRSLTLFTATLMCVLGMSFAAQSATLTLTTDQAVYAISDTITLTAVGDAQGFAATGLTGTVITPGNTTGNTGSGTQSQLTSFTGFFTWARIGTLVEGIPPGTFMMFDQVAPQTSGNIPDQKLTAVMTFHADTAGTASFNWLTSGGGLLNLSFFGLTSANGVTVTIVPEPTTAGLMGLGLIGLAISGRRRKS
jgi:hypothetical protein